MSVIGDLRERKRVAFDSVAEAMGSVSVLGTALRAHRTRDDLRFEGTSADGTEIMVHVATIKEGLPPGQFALWPTVMVRGGPIRDCLDRLPLPRRHLDRLGAVSLATGAIGAARRLSFAVRAEAGSTSPALVARLIRESFLPFAAGFVGDCARGVRACLQWPESVARPFSTAVLLTALLGAEGRDDWLALIRAAASSDPRFWDFRSELDPDDITDRMFAEAGDGDWPSEGHRGAGNPE